MGKIKDVSRVVLPVSLDCSSSEERGFWHRSKEQAGRVTARVWPGVPSHLSVKLVPLKLPDPSWGRPDRQSVSPDTSVKADSSDKSVTVKNVTLH